MNGLSSPAFERSRPLRRPSRIYQGLDHIAVAVERGSLDSWVGFLPGSIGFEVAHREDVATEQSGMTSRVVQHPSGVCKFPLVEPAPGKRKSQVQGVPQFSQWPWSSTSSREHPFNHRCR